MYQLIGFSCLERCCIGGFDGVFVSGGSRLLTLFRSTLVACDETLSNLARGGV